MLPRPPRLPARRVVARLFSFAIMALVVFVVLTVARAAVAGVVNVPGNAATIQAGIDLANGGDEVVIADGTWTGVGNRDVLVTKSVRIRSASGNPALCIMDCQSAARGFRFQAFSSGARLESITIKNGSAPNGAGILFTGASPTIDGCWILANTATSTGGGGVAMESASSPRLVSCRISGNIVSGSNGGGGIWNVGGSPVFVNCVISGNKTQGVGLVGGGLYTTSSGTPVVTNCVFYGNTAYEGSGIYCTFSSNPTVTNSVLWANTATQPGPQIVQALGATATVTYSDVQGGLAGTGNLNTSAVFADADGADNLVGTSDDDFHLGRFSPCTDAGNNSATGLTGVTKDAGGLTRKMDDTGVADTGNGSAPIIDIGPYERQTASIPVVFYVPADQPTLQAAVNLSGPGDEIRLANGTHTGAGNRAVVIDHDVTIRSESGNPNLCVLDAQNAARVLSFVGVGANTRLENVTVTHGLADKGGGMFLNGASPTLVRVRIVANTANVDGGGGMYCLNASSPTMTGCEIRDNVAASTYGGGIYNRASSNPVLTNCVLSGNNATGLGSTGGAMYNWTSSPVMTNCSFGANTAYDASVMYNQSTSLPQLKNCIVWGNAVGQGNPITNLFSSVTTITYSDVQGGATGTGNIQVDPIFLDADLRIADWSMCVDAGNNAYVTVPTDLGGLPRIVDGNGDAIATVDMGAHEVPSATASPMLPEASRGLVLLPPRPNPSSGEMRCAFRLSSAGRVTLTVHDASGRRVRTLVDGTREAGAHDVTWDGRDDAGRSTAAGVYLFRVAAEGRTLSAKVARIR